MVKTMITVLECDLCVGDSAGNSDGSGVRSEC